MIYLTKEADLEAYGLFLKESSLNITKKIEDYLLIDKSLKIVIQADCKIVDIVSNGQLDIKIAAGCLVDYQIINAINISRHITCAGSLNLMAICLNETCENLRIDLVKEKASADVKYLVVSKGYNQNFLQCISHLAKATISNIANFGVAMAGANIVFDTTGKIVKKMAKSKCSQISKGIVMDDSSCITSKPILLIDEYDVLANHGASIGKLSDENLFYLMSRGLTKWEAFLLILEGIIAPFIAKLPTEEYKNTINQKLEELIKR